MAIMTPKHSRWQEFCERLEGPEGCDFREDEKGRITWSCAGGRDKTKACAILSTIPDIDIDDSLEFFERQDGYCDCEILFNVKDTTKEDETA